MQNSLDIFHSYCEMWNLQVNVNKTKVMIFSKRKVRKNIEFYLNGKKLEIVDTFTYLGVLFKYNGCFIETRNKRIEQAHKALFSIYKLIQNESIPIDVKLKMFDSMVEPILLYGSEVWGFEDMYLIEQVHLKFCKRILRVRNTTANFMVYGELGRFPLELRDKLRMISFWAKLVQSEGQLSNMLYCLLFCLQSRVTIASSGLNK